ncbi:glycosyltransferase family 39 protein [Streptomyces sp. 8L]|uniref:glycosyltransferase family 39 protein n=1 Tax=Streptomyces sp. 8L TaxID=2877242 RepID=UPI001CD6EB35|nr:glycosyltransferase family 39 protein [Streptomyces sp. 8L]MCA1224108.1 glycosyltransferase family 39 protein [Streptomyces sp. 8L]
MLPGAAPEGESTDGDRADGERADGESAESGRRGPPAAAPRDPAAALLVPPAQGAATVLPARGLLAGVLCYAGVRGLGVLVLAIWSAADGKSAHTLLSARWDSLWYVRVVEHGYGYTLAAPDGRTLSDMAFFPLLPWLEGGVSELTGLGHGDAGLAVSAAASLAAAGGIFATVHVFGGPRVAFFSVVLWAALPVGIVQSMAYSESLFTALAAWALYGTLKERWVLAGALAACAGLTRPIGLAVAAAVLVAAIAKARREGLGAGAVLGVLLAPSGACAYVLWVGARTGGPFGYLGVQGRWGNGFDGGLAFAAFVGSLMHGPEVLAGLALVAGVGLLLHAYALGFRRRYPPAVQAYAGIVLLLALCSSGYFGSKPRLLMPAFTVLVPLAALLARCGRRTAAALSLALVLASALYGAFWLNGSGPP